jgi:hypothetical protein
LHLSQLSNSKVRRFVRWMESSLHLFQYRRLSCSNG